MDRLIAITDLRSNAKQVIADLDDRAVTVVSRSKPVAVLLRPDRYEALLDRLDELSAELAVATAAGDTVPWSEVRDELS